MDTTKGKCCQVHGTLNLRRYVIGVELVFLVSFLDNPSTFEPIE